VDAALDVLEVQLVVLDATVLDSVKAVVIQLAPQVVIVTAKDVLVHALVVPDAQVVQDAGLVAHLLALEAVLDALVVVPAVPQHVRVDVLAVQVVVLVVRLPARADAQVVRGADQGALQHVRADVLDALVADLVVHLPAREVVQVVQDVVLVAPQHVLEVARELVMDALAAVADIVILDAPIVHKLVIIMLLLQCQLLLKLQRLIN
jgi:hypothetical protein